MSRSTTGTRRRTMTGLLAATLLVGLLAACGGSNDDTAAKTLQPLPAQWSASGQRTVEQIAKKIQGDDPNRCAKVNYVEPSSLEAARQRYDWNIAPEALGDCNADAGEDPEVLEIGAFRTAADRDAFVGERTTSICRRAAAVQATIPPFAWVTGDAWSVQADSGASAKAIAKQTGGKADVRACNLDDTLGWTKDGVQMVRAVAQNMSGAVPCSGFGLLERSAVTQNTKGVKTPAAIGACTVGGSTPQSGGATGATADATVVVAAFDKQSQPRAQFLEEALTGEAVCKRPSTAVTGTGTKLQPKGLDWAIVVPSEYAAAVATATGGTAGRTCG